MVVQTGARVALSRGLWLAGVQHCEARVRPVGDEDEEFLRDSAGSLAPGRRATELLARCVEVLGLEGADPQTSIRTLPVGDREALLLHLRRLTLGEQLHAVVQCPAAGCDTMMDVLVKVSDLLVPLSENRDTLYERTIVEGGRTYAVQFRLPTGADVEAAVDLTPADPEAAAAAIMRRCVVRAVGADSAAPVELPASAWRALSGPMSELDPQAEIQLDLVCPACGIRCSAVLDAGGYLLHELEARLEQLYRHIHTLALHYHWSEREIRGMPLDRRQRYLQLLAETQSGARR